MAISPGARLGPYEILSPIGAGGMGEVYKARDTRLDRTVAIKVLPEHIAKREDLRARFERKARAVALLNHPNICVLYDIGNQDGAGYMVMEYMEGETLAARIEKGALPLDQALKFATQIADALDRAHRAGVTHRDVKPANIMLTRDGVKVLDFGLAKSTAMDASMAETQTALLTIEGTVLGTPQYMSPEQFEGKEADARSDIWAFGAVLYEMVTGQKAFQGKNYSSLVGAILGAEPPPMAVKPFTPAWLERLVRRCLAKDPEDRWQSMRDVVLELRTPLVESAIIASSRSRLGWLAVAAAAAMLIASGLALVHFRETPLPLSPLVQTEMPLPAGVVPRYGALSPDGSRVVMEGTRRGGRRQLYLRPLSARAFTPIPGTEDVAGVFWSPDGQWLAFGSNGKLMKWNVIGGQQPQIVCSADIRSGTWSADGVILFAEEGKPIQRVPAAGGVPRNALELDPAFGEQSHTRASFVPGGKAFLYQSNGKVRGAFFFATLDGKVRRHLFDNPNSPPGWMENPSGGTFLAYIRNGQLLVRPFNAVSGELAGEAVLLVDGVINGPNFSFAGTRYLAYSPGRSGSAQLLWYGRDGKPAGMPGEPGELGGPEISPDGKRVMFIKTNSGKSEIWLTGVGGAAAERIAAGSGIRKPIWTPDGRILYSRREAEGSVLIERPADALGVETNLARFPGNVVHEARSISADGKLIAVAAGGGGKTESSLLSRPDGKLRSAQLVGNFGPPVFSPDGRWLAQLLHEGSGARIVVRTIPADPNAPLPPGTREIALIATRVGQIRWSADGKELFILAAGQALMSLPIDFSDGTPRSGTLRKLFDAPRATGFDVTADGRRFVVVESVGEATDPPVVLIQNWPALLSK